MKEINGGKEFMDKKVIQKSDWQASFNLIGKPIINDFTFKIDEHSEKSNWVYNALNLGIDCGESAGTVYCEAMGGYGEDRENKIFAHGKDDNGNDDFSKPIIVDWEDRFDEEVLEEIGDLSFITIGIEKTDKGSTYYKKFLSEYDAIAYLREHLTDDMVVNVKGRLTYSTYNDVTQVRKSITSIALSKADDPSKYKATFTQSILIDKDSASLKDIDKDKGVMYVNTRVLDYVKEINGVEIRGQYPYNKQFEFEFPNLIDDIQCKNIYDKLFKVKKGVTQLTMEGVFIESGAVITATLDDLPDDIRDLVDMGVYTEEEACAKCTANGNRERRMVLKKPSVKLVGDDKVPVLQKFEEKYTEEDLYIDLGKSDDDVPFEVDDNTATSSSDVGDLDWLNAL